MPNAMIWKATKTSAALSLLFLLVYGSTNYLTSLRHNVPSFFFEWERHIPFVPLMIIPYMSIDLFFIAAPFICRDDRQRRTLSNRITAAIVMAGLCFLLIPLRFAFDRPHVGGWLGLIFDKFRSMDQPFNQFPSLHITLRTILAHLYVHRTRGLLRWSLRIWFSLIGFSTLLTYQHHIIDVIGGFALAGLCFYFFQDQPLRQPVLGNPRVGAYYGAGAIVLAALAFLAKPWGYLLLWPALSLSLVSAAYFALGPGIFRKQQSRLPFTTGLLLWPVLLAQRLSLLYYSKQTNAWNTLTENIWIGRQLTNSEAQQAVDQGVSAVLDLSGEFSEAKPFCSLAHLSLPVMDLTAPTPKQLDEAIDFIHQKSANGIVYIHCKAGYSRTAAIAGAYLLSSGQVPTVEQAVAQLRAVRPSIIIRPEALQALRNYFETHSHSIVAGGLEEIS